MTPVSPKTCRAGAPVPLEDPPLLVPLELVVPLEAVDPPVLELVPMLEPVEVAPPVEPVVPVALPPVVLARPARGSGPGRWQPMRLAEAKRTAMAKGPRTAVTITWALGLQAHPAPDYSPSR
jgi:hypothetical protein